MKESHALVDFENVQPSLEELAKLAPGFTDVWLFHGPHQAKWAQHLADAHHAAGLYCDARGLQSQAHTGTKVAVAKKGGRKESSTPASRCQKAGAKASG